MAKMQSQILGPQQHQEILATLIYQGLMPAIRLHIKLTGSRLQEAKIAVEKIGQEIQPGPA